MSHIDAHYVSRVVTVMTAWQEVVQVAASHMEGVDTTTYLARQEDAWRATHEYVKEVIQAHEKRNAAHAEEQKRQKEAIKANDFKDSVVCLLRITWKAARTQAEKAVDAFLSSIKATLHKHIPISTQGPLIANALSMAFQFQMSVWHMIGKECVRPIQSKHSDWCNLAGIVQAIVETFPKNCALMFPPIPVPASPTTFSSTFKPASSDKDDDDDTLGAGRSFHRFETSTPTPSDSGRGSAGGFGHTLSVTSTPLPHGGDFIMVFDNKGMPSGVSRVHTGEQEDRGQEHIDEELDLGIEADDEADGDKEAADNAADKPIIDPNEVELLKTIIKKVPTSDQPSTVPKSEDKQGSTHLDDGSGSLDSSAEDMDASRRAQSKKKGGHPPRQPIQTSGVRQTSMSCGRSVIRQISSISRPIAPTRSPRMMHPASTPRTTASIWRWRMWTPVR